MNRRLTAMVLLALTLSLVEFPMAKAEEQSLPPVEAPGDMSGAKDFDFLMGDWRVRHRIKRPLPNGAMVRVRG